MAKAEDPASDSQRTGRWSSRALSAAVILFALQLLPGVPATGTPLPATKDRTGTTPRNARIYETPDWNSQIPSNSNRLAVWRECNEKLQTAPDDLAALKLRASIWESWGMNKAAYDDYSHIVDLIPNSAAAYYKRATCSSSNSTETKAARQKRCEENIADLNRCIELEPTYFQAYLHRALTRSYLADLQGAISDFTEAINLDPDWNWRSLYWQRGDAKALTGDHDGAIVDYMLSDKACDRNSKSENERKLLAEDRYALCRKRLPSVSIIADLEPESAVRPNVPNRDDDLLAPAELSPDISAPRTYQSGLIAYSNTDRKTALIDSDRCVRENPYFVNGYILRALAENDVLEHQQAIADLEIALKLDSKSKIARYNLAILLIKSSGGGRKRAAALLTQLLHNDSSFADAYYARALAAEWSNNYKAMVTDLTHALNLGCRNKKHAEELLSYAREQLGGKSLEENLDYKVKHYPEAVETLFTLAAHETSRARYEKALQPLNRLLSRDSENLEARRCRAACLDRLGRYTEADADRRGADAADIISDLSTDPIAVAVKAGHKLSEYEPPVVADDGTTFELRAAFREKYGDLDNAILDYKRAMSLEAQPEEFGGPRYRLALVLQQQKRYDDAIAAITPLMIKTPGPIYSTLRGHCYLQLGQFSRALKDANDAVRLDKYSYAGYDLRGEVLFHQKQYRRSIADLDRALHCNESSVSYEYRNAHAWLYMAACQLMLADPRGAEESLYSLLENAGWRDSLAPYAVLLIAEMMKQSGRQRQAEDIIAAGKHRSRNENWPSGSFGFLPQSESRQLLQRLYRESDPKQQNRRS